MPLWWTKGDGGRDLWKDGVVKDKSKEGEGVTKYGILLDWLFSPDGILFWVFDFGIPGELGWVSGGGVNGDKSTSGWLWMHTINSSIILI